MPIISLIASIKNVRANGLDLSPDYQRGYIWSNEYKDQLILSIILNYPIGNIVINNLDQPNQRNARQELVDGKQRLTTIFRFMEVATSGNGSTATMTGSGSARRPRTRPRKSSTASSETPTPTGSPACTGRSVWRSPTCRAASR